MMTKTRHPSIRAWSYCVLAVLLAAVVSAPAYGQVASKVPTQAPNGPNTSFSYFLGLSDAELANVQGKLTWVFVQAESIPYVGFAPTLNQIDPNLYAPFRRPSIHYGNDNLPSDWVFVVSVDELRAVIQNLNGVPAVAAGTASGSMVSVSLLHQDRSGQVLVAEAIVDTQSAVAAIDAIEAALPAGHGGIEHLTSLRDVVLGND